MAEILVRIGAAIDPSLPNAFRPLLDGAERANEALGRGARRAGATQKTELANAAKAAKAYADAMRQIEKTRADQAAKETQRATKAELKAFDERIKAAQRASREKARVLRDEEREIIRTAERATRAEQRARARSGSQRGTTYFGRDFANHVGANVGGVARGAARFGGAALRGTGFDTDAASMFSRGVDLERLAVSLSNQGVNVNDGKGRIDPKLIEGKIRGAADMTAQSRTDIGGGIGEFVTRTGDLQAGLGMLDELAKLAKVADANFVDMGGAAGEVANALGEMPADQKAAEIVKLMNAFAAMGKMGAVELKDMATSFGKVGAASTAFEGNGSDNLRMMGAFLQLARAKGGAASARESATAIAGMANTLKTPARIGKFREEGIEVLNPETGMIRDPSKIIMDALAKTGGDPERMKKMFANVIGAKPAEAMATTFRRSRAEAIGRGASQESATQQGLADVKAELDRFKNATIDATEFSDSFAAAMNTTSSKAQLAQNRFDDIADRVMEKVLPALERLEPGVTKAAEAFTGIVAWAAENPGAAITAAIVGSIAKAGIEASIRSALAGLGGASAGAVGALGAIAAAALLAAAGMKTFFDLQADQATTDAAKNTDRGVMADALVRAREKQHRGQTDFTPLEREALGKGGLDMQREMMRELELADRARNPLANVADLFVGTLTGGPEINNLMRGHEAAGRVDETRATLERMNSAGMKDPFAESAAKIAAAAESMAKAANITVTINTPQGVNEGARSSGSISGRE